MNPSVSLSVWLPCCLAVWLPVWRAAFTPPEGATVVSSRGCRRGPQDRGKPTVGCQTRSSPTGGEYACARIEGTAFARPRGHVRRVRCRVAREGYGTAVSAVCATPAGVGSVLRPSRGSALRSDPRLLAGMPPACGRRGTLTSSGRREGATATSSGRREVATATSSGWREGATATSPGRREGATATSSGRREGAAATSPGRREGATATSPGRRAIRSWPDRPRNKNPGLADHGRTVAPRFSLDAPP